MQVRCPECSRLISDTATACPSCGYVITPAMAERMRTAATMPLLRRRSTWIAWGCIALFVATVAYCASLPEPPLTQCEESNLRAVRVLSGMPDDARLPQWVVLRMRRLCWEIEDHQRERDRLSR